MKNNYKENFKKEYKDTKERYENLKIFNTKYEALEGLEELERVYPFHRKQQATMGEYLHLLELRAILEGINLWEET